MRESFIFYKSFYDAIETLGEKAQLKLYKSIMKLNFNCCENVTELEQLCDDIETTLQQNRNVFAQFLLIKPQILANSKRYFNGLKGASHGALGGAPAGNTNAAKNNPKTTPNKNDNVNVNGLGVNSPPTPPQENSHNFYSEYKNVGLTDSQYQSLLGLTQSTQALNLIIEEFASAIETGKENAFTYELPNAHFERLKQFWKWRKKHPPKQDVPKLSSYEDFYNYLTGLPKDEVQIE